MENEQKSMVSEEHERRKLISEYLVALKAFRDAAVELDQAWERAGDNVTQTHRRQHCNSVGQIAEFFEGEVKQHTAPHSLERAAMLGRWED